MGSSKNDDEFSLAMELAMGTVVPMTVKAAFELGVFEIIARSGSEAKLSSEKIAAQLSTNNPDAPMMLDRILKLLASHSLLTSSLVGHLTVYGLTPLSRYFVPDRHGVSLGPLACVFLDNFATDTWSKLKDFVLEGIPYNGAHAYERANKDPRFGELFNTGMLNLSTLVVENILESYKGLQHLKQLVDVGGGKGVTLSLIVAKYPFIKAINFDLPQVICNAPTFHGVDHVGGDMFESVPQGDAIFLKWILHNWDDEHCVKLLKNCYKAIPDDGKVIVVECVVVESFDSNASGAAAARNVYKFDMVMMTQIPGGKERTRDEYMALALSAGFSGITFVCDARGFSVMEFFK